MVPRSWQLLSAVLCISSVLTISRIPTFYATILQPSKCGLVLTLPQSNQLTYTHFQPDSKHSARFTLTPSGAIVVTDDVSDLSGQQISLTAVAKDTLYNHNTSFNVILDVGVTPRQDLAPVDRYVQKLYRRKRAILQRTLLIPSVNEDERNILLDYGAAGIALSNSNRYYLVQGAGLPFTLNSVNGELNVKSTTRLDYETAPNHQYLFTVFINGTASGDEYRVAVTLSLVDINDEPPMFTMQPFPYITTTSPNVPGRTRINYQLTVNDPDSNFALEYSLVSGSGFEVTPDGKIFSLIPLTAGVTYPVRVRVEDVNARTNRPQTSTVEITIHAGNRAPQFYQQSYTATLSENIQRGHQLNVLIRAKSFQGDLILFNMNDQEYFEIVANNELPNSAVIKTLKMLDYETHQNSFQMQITARERGSSLSSTVLLRVNLIDENDNPPRFDLSEYVLEESFPENAPLGTVIATVQATDADQSINNGKITYRVDGNAPFSIDTRLENNQYLGTIKTAGRLDYDTLPGAEYRLKVLAVDGGSVPQTGSVYVRVKVLNTNDEPPQFASPRFERVEPSKAINSVITTVLASDLDQDDVQYAFSVDGTSYEQHPSYPFRIDADTGSIYLTDSLNKTMWSDISNFPLNISATDDSSCCPNFPSPQLTGYTTVNIEIVGRNHNPQFGNCTFYSSVAKAYESTADQIVVQVQATDEDTGNNGKLTYSLVNTFSSNANRFTIDPVTGLIKTTSNAPIDRETETHVAFTVKVEDGAAVPLADYCTITMTVLDINDNDPQIDLPVPYDVDVNKPANSTILELYATDADFDINGSVTFTIKNNPNFYVLPPNILRNSITLSSTLPSPQTMTVVATDGGGRNTSRVFRINIKQKTNAPRFIDPTAFDEYQVPENAAANTILYAFKAQADDGGRVNYYIVPQSTRNAFYNLPDDTCIAENRMCLAVYQNQKLDASVPLYLIKVRVTPQNTSSNAVTEQTITVRVIDVNNKVPEFENRDENGYVIGSAVENSNVFGTQVLRVRATDADVTASYRTVTFSMLDGLDSNLFSIDTQSGIIRVNTNTPFDRETKDSYRIKVKAIDGAPSAILTNQQPNAQVVDVQINIIDVNDNPPYFNKTLYTGNVEETAVKGTKVMTVRASDRDIDNNFAYSIRSGNIDQVFQISNSGEITVFNPRLDYEGPNKVYDMEILVSDGTNNEATTNLRITVLDMNDNIPVFSHNVYNVNNVTEEDESITPNNRYPIVSVKATDGDISRETNIKYSLDGTHRNYFHIDENTGLVSLVDKLDRDAPKGRAAWDINVLASDEPGSPFNRIGYAIIRVYPSDINDNFPEFIEDSLTGNVDENADVGTIVMTVRADDIDAAQNGASLYSLVSGSIKPTNFPNTGGTPYFTMDSSGVIKTNAVFDRENTDRYTLEVIAADQGQPSRSTTGIATILIGDKNDNNPEFTQEFWKRSVSEFAGPGAFILQVTAEDVDIDDTLVYSLDTEARYNFSIDMNGVIELHEDRGLDFEHFYYKSLSPQINITVTVNDGNSDHTAQCKVYITVIDENDEIPIFNTSEKTVRPYEDISVGSLIATFTASDRDADTTPRNSEIKYYIERTLLSDADRYFTLNENTGVVRTEKLLDRETIHTHTVIIQAVDNGFPLRMTGSAVLTVNVQDINDNGPYLKTPVVYIEENVAPGTSTRPLIIAADDPDDKNQGHGAPFVMRPASQSENNDEFAFIFHSDWDVPDGFERANGAGEITTKVRLDREDENGPERHFFLQLTDNQNVSAIRDLTIIVADEDDNPPRPAHKDALIYNYRGWPSEYELVDIGDCYAEDDDDWDKPYKKYYTVGVWPPGFSIDEDSGMMTANLTQLSAGVYNYRCNVTDRYIPDVNCAYQCKIQHNSETARRTCIDGCRVPYSVISTVTATIKIIDQTAAWNGVSVRLEGDAEEFMKPGAGGESQYQKFINRLASNLGTAAENVDIFSVVDSQSRSGYFDVRYIAHGSPNYNQTKLLGAIINDPQFGSSVGVVLSQVPVNECIREIYNTGCTNTLDTSAFDNPLLVNANGSSLVGLNSRIMAVPGCYLDNTSPQSQCTPHSCLHGGECTYNTKSKTTRCKCPAGFDGPRCQQRIHSFNGNSWAQYLTLSQCGSGSTSIEFITKQQNTIIFYNGPNSDPGSGVDAVTDYIAFGLIAGRPTLFINFGTGYVKISATVSLSDNKWHKVEIFKTERDVTMVVDDCKFAAPDADTSVVSRDSCEYTTTARGENKFLNVDTLLEMGGRGSSWWPSEIDIVMRASFDGCVRNFMHNGELYDLHIGQTGLHFNSEDGCPREDQICGTGSDSKCGINGICESSLDGSYTCMCKPGWQGTKCEQETEYLDFETNSYASWGFTSQFLTLASTQSYTTEIQLSFRSRDPDGNGLLFSCSGSDGAEYIKLQIMNEHLALRYNIGSDNVDAGLMEQSLTLLLIPVTDGDLHTVKMIRVGSRVTLILDGGEGHYIKQYQGYYSHQLFVVDSTTYVGADVTGQGLSNSNISDSTDLSNSCVTDIRFNGRVYPVTQVQSDQDSRVKLTNTQAVKSGCANTACSQDVNCPSPQICVNLWRLDTCSCPSSFVTLATSPYCRDINECFPVNPCIHGACINTEGAFRCECKVDSLTGRKYTGALCNAAQTSDPKILVSDAGVVALCMALLVAIVLLIAGAVFCVRRQNRMKGDSLLIDPYDDIRETIYNYDEEGMAEEDQDGYDMSRLSKPVYPPIQHEPLQSAAPVPGDQPDVGGFISDRLNDADDDPGLTPGDEMIDFADEGNESLAGTLSSLNTLSSGGDQDFNYLNDFGPKFSRLADMYSDDL